MGVEFLSPDDEVLETFRGIEAKFFLEHDGSVIQGFIHLVNRHARDGIGIEAVKRPEVRQHAAVSGKLGIVDVDAAVPGSG